MTTQTEALRLVYNALIDLGAADYEGFGDVLDALEKSLKEPEQEDWGYGPHEVHSLPEQEPVAWMNVKRDMTYLHGPYNADDIPLYTTPPQRTWVGLTDEVKLDLISDAKGMGGRIRGDGQLFSLLEEHEAELKEKNK